MALSFPLHPPGRPASSRVSDLAPVAASALVIQGTKDPFGSAEEVAAALAEAGSGSALLVALPGAGHALDGRSQAARHRKDALVGVIVDEVEAFVRQRL